MAMRQAMNQARPAAVRECMPRIEAPKFLLRVLKPREDPKLYMRFASEVSPLSLLDKLSDLPGGLVLLEDPPSALGASFLLWRHLLSQPWPGPTCVLLTDPFTRSVLGSSEVPVFDVSGGGGVGGGLEEVGAGARVMVDSLDGMTVLLGQRETIRMLGGWAARGVCVIAQAFLPIVDFARRKANIRIRISSWDGIHGTADCLHLRGYTKTTRESCSFVLSGQQVLASHIEKAKIAPHPVTAPVFASGKGLIIIEDEDVVSPDEEGDEDDNI